MSSRSLGGYDAEPMAKPFDPRPPAIPARSPDSMSSHVESGWEDISGEELSVVVGSVALIEDSAPPITHWDLVSDDGLPAVGDSTNLPRASALPETRPSLTATPSPPSPGKDSRFLESELNPPPLPNRPPPGPDLLAQLLEVPSPESMAPIPGVTDLPTPKAMASLEVRERAMEEADVAAAEPPEDSIRDWLHGAKKDGGEDTNPVANDGRGEVQPIESPPQTPRVKKPKAPAVMFAESPPRTGPAIAFAEEPEPDSPDPAQAPSGSSRPLQDLVRPLVGSAADLVIEPPAESTDTPVPFPLPARYRWISTLGEGGQGRVELVFDRDLGRQVALKTLHLMKDQDRHLTEFYAEARITGQLEHPNIMPVHDAGQLPDGRLFYTMRRMPGENLHNVLSKLRRGDADTLRRWSLADLVRVLRQACMGVGYAHDSDVLHRDLKPANILLGGHDEVLVVDWGIARFVPKKDGVGVTDSIRRRLWSEARDPRRERVRGSPPYMAPEQVKHPDQVGAAADVFCLGVILYEILTRFPPFSGKNVEAVVEALCHEKPVPPRERAPQLSIPAELEEICLRALEKFPGHRFASATELGEALGRWQSGTRRKELASRRLREATEMRSRYQVLVGRKRGAIAQLLKSRGPVGRHRPNAGPAAELSMVSDRVDSLVRAADGVFAEAVWALSRALADDPENNTAQSQLAELYSDRYAEAERSGLTREMSYFRGLLRQFDDGRWGRWLRAGGELQVAVRPEGTELVLRRIEERDGRLVPGESVDARSPGEWSVAPGRYALVPKGHSDPGWHYPVLLRRNQRLRLQLDLRGEEHAGERFCFVPGGHSLLGGDPLAPGSEPEREQEIPAFAIARHPVSVGAYARFLVWLDRMDEAKARERTPANWADQTRRGGTRPVTNLSLLDARRYCAWLTQLTGVHIRLPSSDEWEKAVRGTDGRFWPWGNTFVSTATASLHTCEPSEPLPVPGSFPLDSSPFGVEDGVGLVWEWTETSDGELQVSRGGSVNDGEFSTRAAARRALQPDRRLPILGFRVVREINGA